MIRVVGAGSVSRGKKIKKKKKREREGDDMKSDGEVYNVNCPLIIHQKGFHRILMKIPSNTLRSSDIVSPVLVFSFFFHSFSISSVVFFFFFHPHLGSRII